MDGGSPSDGGSPPDSASSSDGGNDSCESAFQGTTSSVFGQTSSRFTVWATTNSVIFRGEVFDGQKVDFHTESERQGLCRLLRYTPSFCTPSCENGEVCIDSSCVAHPTIRPVGNVLLSGIGDTNLTIEPNEADVYYRYIEDVETSTLSTVGVSAPGNEGPEFTLTACAVDRPAPTSDWAQLLSDRADGEDVTLRWSDSVEFARIYLRMTTGIGTHGGISPTEIECEGPDTGSLTLPGRYLDALYSAGWSCGECGGNDLFRYHSAEEMTSTNTVQLRVQSSANFWHIPGLGP